MLLISVSMVSINWILSWRDFLKRNLKNSPALEIHTSDASDRLNFDPG